MPLDCYLYALVVGEGWNVQVGNKSEKWQSMSVEARAAFADDIDQKIGAIVAELPLSALINEQNSKVRIQAAQTRVEQQLQAALRQLTESEERERCTFVGDDGVRCKKVESRSGLCL